MNNYSIETRQLKSIRKTIFFSGLLVGTLDALAAIIIYKAQPAGLFKFIASGAFGRETAFGGGWEMVAAGAIFHYLIAYSWTVLLFVFFPMIKKLLPNKFLLGITYGLFIWLVMNIIVIPLSRIPGGEFNATQAMIGASILICMIGIPLSLIANKFFPR